jgi:hypothetical protein
METMSETRVVIFWKLDARTNEIEQDFLRGRLRQGWCCPGSKLVEGGRQVPLDEWIPKFQAGARQYFGDVVSYEGAVQRHAILSEMLKLQRGDIVVVPRMPGRGQFTAATVSDGYWFDFEHQEEWGNDLGHVVQVDPGSRVPVRYDVSPEAEAVARRFRHRRKAVTNVADRKDRQAIIDLIQLARK